jgi:DNA-binding transcriptional MerR regulator
MEMKFTIRELESLTGIKAHTIRIWEQRYHFLKPSRTQTNIRTYNTEELKTLLTVALLNKYGYKISRIDEMVDEQRKKAVLELPYDDVYNENLVNEMIGCMVDIKSMEFEELVNRHINNYGIQKTITELIFRFLEKVGLLWQTNIIIPVQEHIVSNIIRQKIIAAIENLPIVKKEEPLFLLLLPEGEHHEMGLLFVYYLLRKNGIPVIYLGANVPLKDVGFLFQIKYPQYVYLHLTSFPHKQDFQKYLSSLSNCAKNSQIIMSGNAAVSYKKTLPKNVHILSTFSAVVSYVSSIK